MFGVLRVRNVLCLDLDCLFSVILLTCWCFALELWVSWFVWGVVVVALLFCVFLCLLMCFCVLGLVLLLLRIYAVRGGVGVLNCLVIF